MKITVEISDTVARLLAVLNEDETGNVQGVIESLIDHAQQGVYRPGAWGRDWICRVFGDAWETEKLEPGDPYGRPGGERHFMRPKQEVKG